MQEEEPRYCSNGTRCKTRSEPLPDDWTAKLCAQCQEKKREALRRSRAKRALEAAAADGEELVKPVKRARKPEAVVVQEQEVLYETDVEQSARVTLPSPGYSPGTRRLIDEALDYVPQPSTSAMPYSPVQAARSVPNNMPHQGVPSQQLDAQSPYPYPQSNSQLVKDYRLAWAPEGGLAAESYDSAESSRGMPRTEHAGTYHLYVPSQSKGYLHRSASDTIFTLLQGRLNIIFVDPPIDGSARIRPQVLGTEIKAKEQRQIFVPSNSVIMCELPDADLGSDHEHIGCFFNKITIGDDDVHLLTRRDLERLLAGEADERRKAMKIEALRSYLKHDDG